eukprot:CAMPEP_0116018732 /NCGR_PEP_ID=MMETSP0321-20121206/8819_1 /TAXON_ID=163516 /ORGANISM="Leptocylindrus danicus var. danicus, Strain B650" /LENGTH=422 /DNA_ID=CAMNT_0003489173 /DNA_START=221 /DNA_END=1489 /DNA_ORIENTATION=+
MTNTSRALKLVLVLWSSGCTRSAAENVEHASEDAENNNNNNNNLGCAWGSATCNTATGAAALNTESNNNSSGTIHVHRTAFSTPNMNTMTMPLSADYTSQQEDDEDEQLGGFLISGHVVAADDGLSYFATSTSESGLLTIPFTDCGPVGSVTEQLSLKEMQFRNFPAQAETSWAKVKQAQLVVCLHPLEVIVSGNHEETRTFEAGDVILFEDTVGKGHKLRAPLPLSKTDQNLPFEERTLSVMSFNLPQHKPVAATLNFGKNFGESSSSSSKPCLLHDVVEDSDHPQVYNPQDNEVLWFGRPRRRWIFGGVGLTISSALTLTLSHVVPAKYSVKLGHVCLAGAGAYASVKGFEALEDEFIRRSEESITDSAAYEEDELLTDDIQSTPESFVNSSDFHKADAATVEIETFEDTLQEIISTVTA